MDSGVMEDDFFVFPEEDQSKVETNCFPKLVTPHFQLEISLIRFLKLAEYLDEQPWFHGTIRRQIAECRLVKDGEFLIRQSITQPGQFILSVLQNRSVRHICLVSANGTIRSYGYEFGSVIQLIQFHFHNRVPMCSTRTAVLLEIPVARP
uniref:SH2 domain-containing protein n=1 Tax=Panagrolaimus sp. JU765 TaxID=591449 RepID=A0AC34QKF6_9BILA